MIGWVGDVVMAGEVQADPWVLELENKVKYSVRRTNPRKKKQVDQL